MKVRVVKEVGPVCFDLGWFRGEDFKLVDIRLFEILVFQGQVDFVSIFQLQVGKFCIGVGVG